MPSSGSAQDLAEYRHFREARFADVAKANPDMQRKVDEVRTGTQALLAAIPRNLGTIDALPVQWKVPSSLPFIYDVPVAPRMVIVPAGEFTMGSPQSEPGRAVDEGPRRRVRIGYALGVSMFPVTFAEYSLFTADTGYSAKRACTLPHTAAPGAPHDWRNPGFAQTFRSPAVCIGYVDAQAYAAWLTRTTGHRYRLLSEAEYEYAARAGTTTAFWWGEDRAVGCNLANGWDSQATSGCPDSTQFTAELGANKPNAFGLYDMACQLCAPSELG